MRSLRARVFVTILAVSLATLAGVGLFAAHATTVELDRYVRPAPDIDAAAAVRFIQDAYDRGGPAAIAASSDGAARLIGAKVAIVSPSGAMIGASDPDVRAMDSTLETDGTLHLRSPERTASASEIVLRGSAGEIRSRSGAAVGQIYVLPKAAIAGQPIASIAALLSRSIWLTIAWAAIAATLAALLLTSYILRPVRELTLAAKRLAGGDLRTKVAPTGPDEIGDLGRSFNAMARELARLEELREAMVADVAHELRTPLTHMRGRIEALQDGRATLGAGALEALHGDVMQLSRLVSDLQDLRLADAGQLTLRPAPIAIDETVRAVLDSLPPSERLIDLRVAERLPLVYADPGRVRQIVHNLASNALAHVGETGNVWIAASRLDGDVAVEVHDDGPILSADDLQAIFERFYRADPSRSRSTGGAGLGLAIVKKLVEASGGRTWARNTSEPSGVSVTFTLPTADGARSSRGAV